MSTLSIILLIVAVVLLLAYIFYKQILRVILAFSHLIFAIGFLGLTSVVLLPTHYHELTDAKLDASYVGEQLHYTDSTLNDLDSMKVAMHERLSWILGEPDNAPPEPSNLYGSFSSFLGVTFRVIIGTVSLLLMLVTLYFRFTTGKGT